MTMTADTELPSITERINETSRRIATLKTDRGNTALLATRGDESARTRLPGIVAELQAAELELEVLGDAKREEAAQQSAQFAADQVARKDQALAEALANIGKLDRLCAKAAKEMQAWLETSHAASALAETIRGALFDVSTSVHATRDAQRPTDDEITRLCNFETTAEKRAELLARVRRHIEIKRQDLAKVQEPREPKAMRLGAKVIPAA